MLACLLVVGLLTGLKPDTGASGVRYYGAGADGWARSPQGDVKVDSIHLTQRVRGTGSYAREVTTTYAFVVVRLRVSAHGESRVFSKMELRTPDGYTYEQLGDPMLARAGYVNPGFTSIGAAVFEMPPDRVAHSTLVVYPTQGFLVVYQAALRFDQVVPADLQPETLVVLADARKEVTS